MLRPVGLCAALLIAAAGAAVAADSTTLLSVTCDKATGRYSVEANGAQLGELLRQTEKQCGVRYRIEPESDRPVTIHFKGQTVENGLRYLGEEASLNYILFVSTDSAGEAPGNRKITEIRIIGSGKGGGSPAPVASSPTPAVPAEAPSRVAPSAPSTPAPLAIAAQTDEAPASTARERMEKRLKNLPPEEREKKIQEEEERIRKREERNAAAKARREARKGALRGGAVEPPVEE